MSARIHAQMDLAKAIAEIAKEMPPARTRQLYEFALFLESHPLPAEETIEAITRDEAIWEAQFAATSEEKIASLIASVDSEIEEGGTLPMFDKRGEFIEHK